MPGKEERGLGRLCSSSKGKEDAFVGEIAGNNGRFSFSFFFFKGEGVRI